MLHVRQPAKWIFKIARIPLHKGVLCNEKLHLAASSVTLFIKTPFVRGFCGGNKDGAPNPVLIPSGKPDRAWLQ